MESINSDTIQQHDIITQSRLLLQVAEGCCAIEDFQQARTCYEQAAQLDPDAAGPYVGLGMIDYQNGCLEQAELAFKVACRLDKNCSKAYLGIAMIAQQNENNKYAFDMYLKSIECDSDNLTALLGLFQTSCKMGTFSNITRYLEHYLISHKDDTSVMSCLASLYIRDNKFHQAKDMLDNVLAVESDNEVAVNLLEEVEYNLVKIERARAV